LSPPAASNSQNPPLNRQITRRSTISAVDIRQLIAKKTNYYSVMLMDQDDEKTRLHGKIILGKEAYHDDKLEPLDKLGK